MGKAVGEEKRRKIDRYAGFSTPHVVRRRRKISFDRSWNFDLSNVQRFIITTICRGKHRRRSATILLASTVNLLILRTRDVHVTK